MQGSMPLLLATGLLASASLASAQVMVVESTNKRVALFDANDGSLLDDTFIDLTLATPAPVTPIEAIEVNGEVWISDQTADTVFRFSGDGSSFLGTITTGRDNIRGIALANGALYVANSGTGGAGYGDVVKEYTLAGALTNQFPAGDPFDVLDLGSSLLVADILGDDLVEFADDGTLIGIFHDSDGATGIDFPEQLALKSSNGHILAGGFTTPAGIYEYDSSGLQVDYIDVGSSVRGIHELGNGNLLWTSGSGVFVHDIGTNLDTLALGGVSGRYITKVGGAGLGTNYCVAAANSIGPGGATIFASGSLSVAAQSLSLSAGPVPNQPGLFYYGPNQVQLSFGNGFRCIAGTTFRLPVISASGGVLSYALDFNSAPASGIGSGQTWNFQAWYRDPLGSGAAFNLTDGLELSFLP